MNNTDVVTLAQARRYAQTGEGARIRAAALLSLRDVAEVSNCAPATVWRWERGERAPRGDAAVAWARLLHDLQREQRRHAGTA